MRCGLLIIIVLLCSWLSASPLLGDQVEEHALDCGRNSLFILLKLLGYQADLDVVEHSLPPRHPAGYSMLELQTAARSLGLQLQGVRFDKLQMPLKRPVIAYISSPGEGHFIVLRPLGVTGKMVQVIDPPSAPVVIDYDPLLASPAWTGRVLIPQTRAEWLMSWSWIIPVSACLLLIEVLRRRIHSRPVDPDVKRVLTTGLPD